PLTGLIICWFGVRIPAGALVELNEKTGRICSEVASAYVNYFNRTISTVAANHYDQTSLLGRASSGSASQISGDADVDPRCRLLTNSVDCRNDPTRRTCW